MSFLITHGTLLRCSAGAVPAAPMNVLPLPRWLAGGKPVAHIFNAVPLLNIPTFGACAMTPTCPCFPATTAWISSSKTLVNNLPVVTSSCKLMCCRGGMIQAVLPGQQQATSG